MKELPQLAKLIAEQNAVGRQISEIIGRSHSIGHAGEYVASRVFEIELHEASNAPGSDGRFRGGPLDDASVNVKWYARLETLDINSKAVPDYYLVLAGPRAASDTQLHIRPWVIANAYLFAGPSLHDELKTRGVKLGTGTSLLRSQWEAGEIYPSPTCRLYTLAKERMMPWRCLRDGRRQAFLPTVV